jgi:hypothetical protein
MGRSNLLPHESEWGVSICLDLIDQLDNSRTKPLQVEHDGQMSSGRSKSDVRPENCERQARRILPNSVIASQRGPLTLLRLSCPAKRNALDDATIAGIESFFSDPRQVA